jgi:hypothetical protein
LGESFVLLACAFGVLGAVFPDNRWSRAFARGFYWDWVIPRWEVRVRCIVWAAGWAAVAFIFR